MLHLVMCADTCITSGRGRVCYVLFRNFLHFGGGGGAGGGTGFVSVFGILGRKVGGGAGYGNGT